MYIFLFKVYLVYYKILLYKTKFLELVCSTILNLFFKKVLEIFLKFLLKNLIIIKS